MLETYRKRAEKDLSERETEKKSSEKELNKFNMKCDILFKQNYKKCQNTKITFCAL